MKRTIRVGTGLLAVASMCALSACGRGDAQTQGAASAPGGQAGGRGGPRGAAGRVAVVGTEAVATGSIARAVTVSGVVEPIRSVAVNSQLSGALLSVKVEEGSTVRRGDLLAELDGREIEAQLTAAEASFQVAEASFQRAEQLRDRQIITLPEYERERTAYAAAKAQVDQLRTRAGFTRVLAPVDGVVTEKRVEAGDAVGTQTRLFTLAEISTLVVRVGVSELDVVELAEGDPVDVELDAFRDRDVTGRIRRIFPSADPTTRLVPVEVALQQGSERFVKPGFLARTTFALAERSNVLLIPAGALVGGQGSEAVFVVQDGRVTRRTVETGLTSNGRVEIVMGLTDGEQVVTVGNNQLRDGAEVRVVDGGAPAGQGGEQAGGAS